MYTNLRGACIHLSVTLSTHSSLQNASWLHSGDRRPGSRQQSPRRVARPKGAAVAAACAAAAGRGLEGLVKVRVLRRVDLAAGACASAWAGVVLVVVEVVMVVLLLCCRRRAVWRRGPVVVTGVALAGAAGASPGARPRRGRDRG